MSRLRDTILANKAFNERGQAPMVDLRFGGQHGYAPDYASYVSNAAYVRRNLICVLVEAPRGFQDLDSPDYWVSTLKALFELHPKSIEGLKQTLSVEHVESPVGGAGEVQQDIANVTRERSAPQFTWTEKYGTPIASFLIGWVTNLIMDPNSKYPLVVTRGARKPTDLLPDYTGATALFFEPDPTHTKVMPHRAWLCTNMRPNGGVAEITARRDLTAAGETVDYSIEFTALTQVGAGVERFAQGILDAMNLSAANPNLQSSFISQIEADVKAGDGYAKGIDNLAKSAIR